MNKVLTRFLISSSATFMSRSDEGDGWTASSCAFVVYTDEGILHCQERYVATRFGVASAHSFRAGDQHDLVHGHGFVAKTTLGLLRRCSSPCGRSIWLCPVPKAGLHESSRLGPASAGFQYQQAMRVSPQDATTLAA